MAEKKWQHNNEERDTCRDKIDIEQTEYIQMEEERKERSCPRDLVCRTSAEFSKMVGAQPAPPYNE